MTRAARAVVSAAALVLIAADLRAQTSTDTIRAAGRVVRITASDSLPASGVRVVLHRIGREMQGPLDSVVTDDAGRFGFRFQPDTTVLYILTARHAGIQYFSDPVHTNPERPDTAIIMGVHDTSSTAPVSLEARHIVLGAPAEDGTRTVVELLALRNDGPLTRVPRDSVAASWSARIPPQAIGFAVGAGDLAAGAAGRSGDSVVVVAPLSPGERQITLQYLLPANLERAVFPFDEMVESVTLLVEEDDAVVDGAALTMGDSVTVIQGRPFRRWSGSLAAGAALRVELPHAEQLGYWALIALVGLLSVVLAVGALRVFVRRTAPVPAQGGAAALVLDELARLDARYAGRQAATSPDAWREYEMRRALLKQELAAALARREQGA